MTTSTMTARAADPITYGYDDLPHLMSLLTGDEKHTASSTSTLDVLWVLYDRVLRASPDRMDDPWRDRFLLSKGHGPMAYYAVLAAKGFFPVDWLPSFGTIGSRLGHHPDRMLVPGVEISSGSLGHGLPIGVGTALGLRAQGVDARVVVLTGDAELDEGSNAEAIAYAGAVGLESLTAVVVDNDSSTHGWKGGVERRFEVEGWSTSRIDGRNHHEIELALNRPAPGRPGVVVAEVEPQEA